MSTPSSTEGRENISQIQRRLNIGYVAAKEIYDRAPIAAKPETGEARSVKRYEVGRTELEDAELGPLERVGMEEEIVVLNSDYEALTAQLREAKAKLAEAQSFLSMVHTFGHRLPQTVQRELSEAMPRIFATDYREGEK